MSLTPVHQELQEMLPAAALEILEPADLEPVLAHVRDCPECAKLLQEYREAAAGLSLRLPARQLDPVRARVLRTRLLARATGRTDGQGNGRTERPARALRLDRWIGWAVAAGLAGILLIHHSVHRTLDYGWLAAGVLLVVLLGLGIYARVQRRRVAALEGRLADLGPKKTQADCDSRG
jgi:hypothetical protein